MSVIRLQLSGMHHQPTERQINGHDGNEEKDPDKQLKRSNRTPKSTLLLRVPDEESVLIVLGRNGEIELLDPLDRWDEPVSVEIHFLDISCV